MPARPPAHPTHADLNRQARHPSRHAPRLADLETGVDETAADLADVADLSDELFRDGRRVGATLSGRAFVSLAGRFAPLKYVRLVAAGPVLAELAACPHLAHVEQLSLAGCQLGDAGLTHLAASPHLTALRALDLSRNGLTAAGVAALCRSPVAARLTALDVSNNPAGGVESRGLLDAMPSLHDLAMTATPRGWADLAASGRRFGRLSLARSALAGADLSRPVPCDWLDIGFTALGDAGVSALAANGSVAGLGGLDLAGNRLTAAAVHALAGRCPRLEWLGLRANRVGPEAWAVLADAAAFPALRRVEL